jgi:hypothetical protein
MDDKVYTDWRKYVRREETKHVEAAKALLEIARTDGRPGEAQVAATMAQAHATLALYLQYQNDEIIEKEEERQRFEKRRAERSKRASA